MSKKTTLLKMVIPLIVIFLGFGIMATLLANRPQPKKEVKKESAVPVRVMTVRRQDKVMLIRGTGTVKAAREVSIIPQVSGQVSVISPKLVVGGFFREGEVLFQVEDTDYRLALEQAKASEAKAEYDLATIESQARIARVEWERINRDRETAPNPLVLYEPQLKNATAALASASASVEQAEIDLQRTTIKAPFNSRVRSEDIDLGRYVKTGESVAVLAGTDSAEILVPLQVDDMQWVSIPRPGGGIGGSPAIASVKIGERTHEWEGRVVRSTGEVDPRSRMMQLVIEIEDPYGLTKKKDPARPVLAVGTFVDVRITGRTLQDIYTIPRIAFRENSAVWVMDSEHKLRVKEVFPLRIEKEEILVTEGLRDGEVIVVTNISGAADGMKLRPIH